MGGVIITSFSVMSGQLLQFFLMLLLGCYVAKMGVVRKEFLGELSKLITRLFLPMYAFFSTYHGNQRQQFLNGVPILLFTSLFYLALTLLFSLLARLLQIQGERGRVYQALFIFGNTGFVGMPLLQALYPGEGMVYMALFTVIDQLLLWTYGLWLTGSKDRQRFRLRNFLNPNTIAITLAVLFVMTGFHLPQVIEATARTMGQGSTAACMVYLGAMFYFSDWKKVLGQKEIYLGVLFKMFLVPLAVWQLLSAFGITGAMLESLIILSALPTMTVIPMLVQSSGEEGEYAMGVTLVTLAASFVTLPAVFWVIGAPV